MINRRQFIRGGVLAEGATALAPNWVCAQKGGPEYFTLAVLPDTQNYSWKHWMVASPKRKERASYSWCSIPNSFRAYLLRKLFSHRDFPVQLAVRAVGLLKTPKSPLHERSWHGFHAARTQNREACGGTVG